MVLEQPRSDSVTRRRMRKRRMMTRTTMRRKTCEDLTRHASLQCIL